MTIDPNVVNIYYHFALDYRKQGGMYRTTLQSPPPPPSAGHRCTQPPAPPSAGH